MLIFPMGQIVISEKEWFLDQVREEPTGIGWKSWFSNLACSLVIRQPDSLCVT
jgi:hypothetical protein